MKNVLWYTARCLFALTCWIILIVALGALFSSSAHARPFTNAECIGVGHAARQIAEYRDKQAPIADIEAAVKVQASTDRGTTSSYIQTADDEAFMMALVARVYALRGLTPDEVEKRMASVCKHLSRDPREA